MIGLGHAPDCPCDSCRAYFSAAPAVGVLLVLIATAVGFLLLR